MLGGGGLTGACKVEMDEFRVLRGDDDLRFLGGDVFRGIIYFVIQKFFYMGFSSYILASLSQNLCVDLAVEQ